MKWLQEAEEESSDSGGESGEEDIEVVYDEKVKTPHIETIKDEPVKKPQTIVGVAEEDIDIDAI